MAALVLALCHPGNSYVREIGRPTKDYSTATWVPASDVSSAIDALLAGFQPVPSLRPYGRELTLRINGEIRASEVRTDLPERLLPVPDEPIPIDALVKRIF
jgi:hypothetical protein